MLIRRLFVPLELTSPHGLQEINLPRLGRYVALAGKNGSGKSRLLNILEQQVINRFNNVPMLPGIRNQINNYLTAIKTNPGNISIPDWERGIAEQEKAINNILGKVVSDDESQFRAIRFVPKNLKIVDPRGLNSAEVQHRYDAAGTTSIESYQDVTFSYIQKVQNRWWNVTHQGYEGDADTREKLIKDYESFSQLVQSFLGVKLTRNHNDDVCLFGKPLADTNLSDGQKVLLQLAVALHAQQANLDRTVLILDELENHLHPSITIELLETLDEVAPNAQIWIATHSVPLLAYIASVEPTAIWYMEDGKAIHSGRQPERVLRGLLGDDDGICRVHEFTGLPALLAANTYAVESLRPPRTLVAATNDPQVNQIATVLSVLANGNSLALLDYGAGKGRLLEGLAFEDSEIRNHLNYTAFDPFPDDEELCCAVISEHYGSSKGRYFNSADAFLGSHDDGCIDVVVMCNVLHEIPPSEWIRMFSETSLIMRALSNDGYLLVVEDQRIPVGEKAHRNGFMVLDTPHLKTLFSITSKDAEDGLFVVNDCRNDGRLKAHLISKKLLHRISAESRVQSIKQLLATAMEEVQKIRESLPSYSNGQLHGFWSQQLANAYIFCSENSGT